MGLQEILGRSTRSARYILCWSSPAQSLLVQSTVEELTIFHCLTTLGFVYSFDLEELIACIRVRVRVRVTLRLAVYRQSVRLGAKPLGTHDQNFYFPAKHLRL
jgi:hypothetical protein